MAAIKVRLGSSGANIITRILYNAFMCNHGDTRFLRYPTRTVYSHHSNRMTHSTKIVDVSHEQMYQVANEMKIYVLLLILCRKHNSID